MQLKYERTEFNIALRYLASPCFTGFLNPIEVEHGTGIKLLNQIGVKHPEDEDKVIFFIRHLQEASDKGVHFSK